MIEPLRFCSEVAVPYPIDRPVLCSTCIFEKKEYPNVAYRFCAECVLHYFCKDCDCAVHQNVKLKTHIRKLLVIGPAVRKKVITRGDKFNYPLPLDNVRVRVTCNIYNDGQIFSREPTSYLDFTSGLSGYTCHIQILGAGNLIGGDAGGLSDPFVVCNYNGRQCHTTRIRQRTLNPRWNNESVVIPLSENLPLPRETLRSQKNLVKLEVYDYDMFGRNDFLGHVEITKQRLEKLATKAKEHIIRLPLSLREFHGLLGVQMGVLKDLFHLKIVRAESLDKVDPFGSADPYVMVYFGDNHVGTTSVVHNTLNPEWKGTFNTFSIPLDEVLKRESACSRRQKHLSKEDQMQDLPDEVCLFRLEVYDHNYFRRHVHLGTVRIGPDYLRKMCPFLEQIIPGHFNAQRAVINKRRVAGAGNESNAPNLQSPGVETKPAFTISAEDKCSEVDKQFEIESQSINSPKPLTKNKKSVKNDNKSVKSDSPPSLSSKRSKRSTKKLEIVTNQVADENNEDKEMDEEETNLFMSPIRRGSVASAKLSSSISQFMKAQEGGNDSASSVNPRFSPERRRSGINLTPEMLAKLQMQSSTTPTNARLSQRRSGGTFVAPPVSMLSPSKSLSTRLTTLGETEDEKVEENNDKESFFKRCVNYLKSIPSKFKKTEKKDADDADDDDDGAAAAAVGKLSKGLSSKLLQRGLSMRTLNTLQQITTLASSKNITPEWSKLRHFAVNKNVNRAAEVEKKNRGYLIVRLILSNRGNVIVGLDEGVRSMTLGETSLLMVRFDYAYGSFAMGPNIPPRSNFVYKVQLISINNMNIRGMPWRQVKRFGRMVNRGIKLTIRGWKRVVKSIKKNKYLRYLYKKFMKVVYGIDIVFDDEIIDVEPEIIEEEAIYEEKDDDISLDTTVTPVFDEIERRLHKRMDAGTVIGAKLLLGFDNLGKLGTKKRVKEKRPRTEQEMEIARRKKKLEKETFKAKNKVFHPESQSLLSSSCQSDESSSEDSSVSKISEHFIYDEDSSSSELSNDDEPNNYDDDANYLHSRFTNPSLSTRERSDLRRSELPAVEEVDHLTDVEEKDFADDEPAVSSNSRSSSQRSKSSRSIRSSNEPFTN